VDYWFVRRLERRTPALPRASVVGGWFGDRALRLAAAGVPETARVGAVVAVPVREAVSGLTYLRPYDLTLRPCRLVDSLAHVERLRKARPLQPRDAVADLEAGVLHGAGEAVPGAGTAEREHVPTGAQDAEALDRPRGAPSLKRSGRVPPIPRPAHEAGGGAANLERMPGKVQRKCPVCDAVYDADPGRLAHGRQTTCSRSCSYRMRASQREQRVSLVCVCGQQFTRSPRQVKAKHGVSYCSRQCHYAGRSAGLTPRVVTVPYVRVAGPPTAEQVARQVAARRAGKGYAHSDETRARLRETTTRAIAEGRIPSVSRVEDVVAEQLDRLGVGYVRQVPIRGAGGRYVACLDFRLDDGRAVEVQGTFWHADPAVYPDGPVHASQRRTAAAWNRKVVALGALGIPVVEVWERAVREDAAQAVAVALAAI
jgi:hypothetical protein